MATGNTGPGRDHAPPLEARRREVERMAHVIAHDVSQLENSTIEALLPSLLAARDELRRGLAQWLAKKNGASTFTAQELRRGLASIQAALAAVAQMRPDLEAQMSGATVAGAGLAADHIAEELARFGRKFGETLRPTQISTAAIIAKTKHEIIPRIRTSAARYVQTVREDMRFQLQLGLAKGETFTELTNRLRRLGGPKGLVSLRGVAGEPGSQVEYIAEGLFNRYRHWAERVVRTEIINAYNVEHVAGIELANEDLEEGDTPLRMRWDSSPDPRRCPICRGLNGKLAPVGKPFPGGYEHPPAHPNCRCVVVAWHESWGDIPGEPEAPQEPKRPHKKIKRQLPPVAIKPPKPPKPKKPPAPRTGEAKALAAAKDEQWGISRSHLEEGFEKSGMHPHPTSKGAKTEVTPLPAGVLGLHEWSGKIKLAPSAAASAKEFAEVYAKDPAGWKKKFKELQAERERTNNPNPPGHDEAKALHEHARKGYEVLVHEVVHGYGPVTGPQYRGINAKVEEVTTETVARKYMRDKFGVTIRAIRNGTQYNGGGAYEGYIQNTVDAIRKVFKVKESTAYRILEAASHEFRTLPQPASLSTAISPLEQFAQSIAKVRPSTAPERNVPRRSLLRADGSMATEHEYWIEDALRRKLTP